VNVFPIAPAESRYLWFVIPVVVLLLGIALAGVVLLVTSVRGSQTSRFEIRADGVRLAGDLYGRLVPRAALRVAAARRVDLAREDSLRPQSRRMGTALPGYQAGWFRLRNGEKALLYLTDRSRAVYVPTTAGYSLLLSPADPDGFLSRLRVILGSGS
jgi:Bacterial PH domain